jgi:lipid A ethanolaminephosphotransferase
MQIQNLRRIHPSFFTLTASVFFVAAYNHSFWKTFIHATGGMSAGNIPLYLGTFLLLVLVFNAFLTLLNFRFVIKPLLILLFLGSAAVSYFMNQYGIVVDASMIQNVVETDVHEAADLLNLKMLATLAMLGGLPSLAVWYAGQRSQPLRRDLLIKFGTIVLCLTTAAILLMIFFKSLAPAVREHRELRFMLTPTNYIQAVNKFVGNKFSRPQAIAAMGRDATKGSLWRQQARATVTVIVVGETARAKNFSLNGYARNTNPELSQQKGLINFSQFSSCGTATAVSVPCVFSGFSRQDYSESKAKSQEGLLDVLSHAGLAVLWRDNNSGCKGACDRVQFEDLSKPVAGDPLCSFEECYDERLLRGLPERMRQAAKTGEDLVIVLHQKGSHGPSYWKRYPEAFNRFGPVCKTNELEKCSTESIVAAYDNTILYTDHFLSQTIDMLRASATSAGIDTALMYFSDHGESLGEKNMYLHGTPYIIAPEEQRHVPFMVWLSEGFQSRFRLDGQCLKARTGQAFSHDNVFHSVLGMLDINTAVYNPTLDIFHACSHGD